MSLFCRLALVALIQGALGDGHDHDHDDTNDDAAGYDEGYHHAHSEGYERIFENYTVNGVPFQQISGLCNNDDSDNLIYYAISDAVDYSWTANKQIYKIKLMNSDEDTMLTGIDSIDLADPPVSTWDNLQTESIAFINNNYEEEEEEDHSDDKDSDSDDHSDHDHRRRILDGHHDEPNYFIIATEGDREVTDRSTNFFVYNEDGTYGSTLEYNEWIFGMTEDSGFKDNAGPESMTPTPDHQYILWAASDTLMQDSYCAHKGCIRLVLQMVNYTTDPPTWKEVAQFRYDKDTDTQADSRYSFTTVTDLTTVDNTFDETLIVERTEYVGDDNETVYYHTKAYHISLSKFFESDEDSDDHSGHDHGSDEDSDDHSSHDHRRRLLDGHDHEYTPSMTLHQMIMKYDISDCYSLHPDNCSNYDMVIGKNLTSNFDVDLAETVPFAKEYHVDTVSHGPGNKCGSSYYNFVLGATDSMAGEDTYLLYLCYHSTQGHNHDDDDDLANKIDVGLAVIIGLLTYLFGRY